ncbi:methyltransferase [Pseudoalteromonas ulvae]|uniref:Ribosomal RNA small subunit methyltransferase C n=1 Tax=Pseudoalteromonas ulvae TaxID=107327 RepID=A0A244CUB0_PSEDV|nr:methyltransferase [Pseudoalteromonas ulvae]OUL59212.1 16S rRNA methyltransferase [Pseudoalteromonas ulvae]
MTMLSNPSQVLLRNEHALTASSILVINFEQDGFLTALKSLLPNAKITAFTSNVANADWAKSQSGIEVTLAAQLPEQNVELVVFYYPKAKPEALMLMDNIRAISDSNTRLLIVGDNKGGVKSSEKQLKEHAKFGRKLDSARHCALYQFSQLTPNPTFKLSDYFKQFTVNIKDTSIDVISMPGVFNHGALDNGTELLLNNMTPPSSGTVLDFGCGAGVISAYLGKMNPDLSFLCLDVSAFAAKATELTLQANHINGKVLLSNGLQKMTDSVDHIVTNPPFHTGLNTDYDITEKFIKEAKKVLKPKGTVTIVANSFLKYPPLLEQAFGQYQQVCKNTKFTVYRVES